MALPFGLDRPKPRHYRDMVRIVWENRDELPFAWRILKDGVCDGCALGTSGMTVMDQATGYPITPTT